MNIEVGEYVRTKDGRIGKLDEIYYAGRGNRYYGEDLDKNYYSIKYNSDDEFGRYSDEEIVKHSKNIIDLIEVGDYVNGKEIHEIDENRKMIYSYERDNYYIIQNRDIQRVVTKEQIEEMEYKV